MGATSTTTTKARIQANKSLAYPTDASTRSTYLASKSTDEWSTAAGSQVSEFQWKVYDLVKQVRDLILYISLFTPD